MKDETTYVGIDPSLRNTGVFLFCEAGIPWNRGGTWYAERIQTDDLSVLAAGGRIRTRIGILAGQLGGKALVAVERQVPSNGMLFYAMMVALEGFYLAKPSTFFEKAVLLPLPPQLKKYMREEMGLQVDKKGNTVRSWAKYKELLGVDRRISHHEVEAHCLAHLAQACNLNHWDFARPEKETPLL